MKLTAGQNDNASEHLMTVHITVKCGQRAATAKPIRKREAFLDEAKASGGILQLCSLGGTAKDLDVALVSNERKT